MSEDDVFSKLCSDLLNKIVSDDYKDWGRLACVSKGLNYALDEACYKEKCIQTDPTLVSDLLSDGDSTSPPGGWAALFRVFFCCPGHFQVGYRVNDAASTVRGSHLDWGDGEIYIKMSPEMGKKLLDDRFSSDCLYISDWLSGCVHFLERNSKPHGGLYNRHPYMLFRGIFKNFKKTMIWRALGTDDGKKYKVDLECPFCSCQHSWDLYNNFYFKKSMEYRNLCGSPLGRAFVCDNGHVFGAWTNLASPTIRPLKFCSRFTWLPYFHPE